MGKDKKCSERGVGVAVTTHGWRGSRGNRTRRETSPKKVAFVKEKKAE